MLDHLHEWLSLVVRWAHVIVGVAWIGTSFYFNWLENRLERRFAASDPLAGDLWAVHGGGFYHVQKYQVAPETLPEPLHWFKWEAYMTWVSGIALLIVLYYFNASAYLVDRSVADISPLLAIGIGLGSIIVSWLVYDGLCRTALASRPALLGVILILLFTLLAFGLAETLNARAAYIHVGAAIGTIMVGNVAAVIIPSQRQMVDALTRGDTPDGALGKAALLRSRHNNYFTLPVLFIMISNHYPITYASKWGWLILLGISLAGILIRHWFNIRHLKTAQIWWVPAGLALLAALAVLTSPALRESKAPAAAAVDFDQVRSIVSARCAGCHAERPIQPGFATAPGGVLLDSDEHIRTQATRIHQAAVVTRSMPLGNLTGITDDERAALDSWYRARKP